MNSGVLTDVAYSKLGNAITKTIVEMDQTKLTVIILLVPMANSLVLITDAYRNLRLVN